MKHAGWTQAAEGSMQAEGRTQKAPPALLGSESHAGALTSAGDTAHCCSDRSKSESMMWPSSRTSTFSGFRSRYTTPSMCRYSRARSTSAA